MLRTKAFILLCALAGATACEKSDEAPKGSGALAATDLELFKSLPGTSNVLFGGNYMKLQDFMQNSAMGKFAAKSTESMGAGMKEWMACFLEMKDIKLAGAVQMAGKGAEMRMVFRGTSIDQLDGCAKKASFASTVDADKKYVSIEVPGPSGKNPVGYLVLANGAIYTRQAFTMAGMTPNITPASRSELEADISGIKDSAADNAKLQALLAKVDRSRTLWFAGTGAGTPIADKLGEAYGTIDITPGIAVDFTLQLLDEKLAKEAEEGVAQLKSQASKAPPEMRSLIEGIKFKRSGDRVRFAAKMTDAQLEAVMQQAGGLGGF